ncbi:sigma-70 family RNA polymerase sigma factor [Oleiharenicola lentus]|uniref:sigma-70 family RNA polymerase sigma factor n=1 Tax=Oleiharenicola lentus TaxID=2508720 RepID=UPI003F6640E3
MVQTRQSDFADSFEPHRAHLMAVAYRFLGTVSEAEDIVQETYLRWAGRAETEVREPKAFLTRIAARLCLDQLKSARVRRERYVGPWLPEPIVHAAGFTTLFEENQADDISVALMLALERLSPLERAAFVLHDAFGQTFAEVAVALDRSPATCRQLATRARAHLRAARPRFIVPPGEGERIVEAFMRATQSGELTALTQLLTADAVLHSDSGGKVRAARRHILGAERIARMFSMLRRKHGPARSVGPVLVNGRPGLLMQDAAGITQTLAFDFRDGSITAIYLVRNPEKLRHLQTALAC